MISSNFVKDWYELAKQIVTDIRSLAKPSVLPLEAEIIDIHAALSDIHAHYVELFAGIENRLIAKPSPEELNELRSTFFEMRSQKYNGRVMNRERIASVSKLDDATRFRAFLDAAALFLMHGSAPAYDDEIKNGRLERQLLGYNFHRDAPHPSSAIRFWKAMLEDDDPENLALIARSEIARLTDHYMSAKMEFQKLGLMKRP